MFLRIIFSVLWSGVGWISNLFFFKQTGNQEKIQTCETRVRTALLSVKKRHDAKHMHHGEDATRLVKHHLFGEYAPMLATWTFRFNCGCYFGDHRLQVDKAQA